MDIKWYRIENMGGGTMAFFGQFENGLYFCGNEHGMTVTSENAYEVMCVENSDEKDIDKWFEEKTIKTYDECNELFIEVTKEINF